MIRVSVASLLLAGALLAHSGGDARATDGNDCTLATTSDSPVAQACTEGGRSAAKKKMKQMITTANKATHGNFRCTGCHSSSKNWTLRDNATADFKKLVASAKTD